MVEIGEYICNKVTDWEIMQFADLVTKPRARQKDDILNELKHYGDNEREIRNELYVHLDGCNDCFNEFVGYYQLHSLIRENKDLLSKYCSKL